jgi:hypothetical protein
MCLWFTLSLVCLCTFLAIFLQYSASVNFLDVSFLLLLLFHSKCISVFLFSFFDDFSFCVKFLYVTQATRVKNVALAVGLLNIFFREKKKKRANPFFSPMIGANWTKNYEKSVEHMKLEMVCIAHAVNKSKQLNFETFMVSTVINGLLVLVGPLNVNRQ